MLRLVLSICLLGLVGCGRPGLNEQDPVTAQLVERYGQAEHLHLHCGMTIRPPGEDSVALDLWIDIDADGTTFIHAVKLGHDVFDALVTAEQDITLILFREDRIVRGNLQETDLSGDDTLSLVTGSIRYLIGDLRDGPVLTDLPWTVDPDRPTVLRHTAAVGPIVELHIDPEQGVVARKDFRRPGPDGTPPSTFLTLDYSKHKTFASRLMRPRSTRVIIPDNDTYLRLSIREVETPAERDPLTIHPPDWPSVPLTTWLQNLQEQHRASTSEQTGSP